MRDGDRVVDEITSEPRACYNEAQLVELWHQAAGEVDAMNAAEAELAKPSRKQRRAAKKKPPSA